MEPMESLRYLPWLSGAGRIVTASKPFVNIPDYPAQEAVMAELEALPRVTMLDIDTVALEHKIPRGANMILLGMTAPFLGILSPEALRAAVARVFAPKGEAVVEADLKAFDLGIEAAGK
jgi:indolepyruvate ferredoxin oxidoreductase beta subunit